MAEIACFLSLLMGLRSHNTCNQRTKYMVIYRTILCSNIRNLFHERVRNHLHLNLKFHDYSSFFMPFDVASTNVNSL